MGKVRRGGERHQSMKASRPLPPVFLLVAMLAVAGLHFFAPGARFIAFPWNLLGLLPVAAGVWLNLAADRALREHRTTVKPFAEPSALVTAGVYRLSRHPMYLGFVLLLLGLAVLSGRAAPLAVPLALALTLEFVYIRSEERTLRAAFGGAWESYRLRVRKWL